MTGPSDRSEGAPPTSLRREAASADEAVPRRIRIAQVAAFLVIAAALLFTVAQLYRTSRGVGRLVAQSDGMRIVHQLRREARLLGGLSSEDLEWFRGSVRGGVHCVRLLDPDQRLRAEAGSCVVTPTQLDQVFGREQPPRVIELGPRGQRFGLLDRGPPERPVDDLMPEAAARSRRPPVLWIEFQPIAALEFGRRVNQSLVAALFAVGAMIVAAAVLWRLSRRAEDLRLAHEKGAQLRRLGEMSAVIAHEIRNPLASLKGHAQLLEEMLDGDERSRGKASRVVGEAIRLEELTEDLLSFVRSNQIERTESDPREVLREAVAQVGADGFELEMDGAPDGWPLDPDRIRQALVNVLQNAREAAPAGRRGRARVGMESERLFFVVRDFGEGLPPGEEEAIFEAFRTGRVRGTGLGLAIARRVLELHGGSITARNHPEGGAEFRLELPRRG